MSNVGIYCIRNTSNNKRYIGSSRNITGRWRVHKSRLTLNKHHSTHLQKSYNLGTANFVYEIIELVDDLSQLEAREQYWVDNFQSYKSDYGYNAVRTVSTIDPARMRERWAKPGAKEAQSLKMKEVCSSLEHRKKLSIGHIEHFKDPNNRLKKVVSSPLRKGVVCVQTGQVFLSISQAAKDLGVSVVKIRDSANGKRRSNGLSFRWI
jgi:group I intron endonuclease